MLDFVRSIPRSIQRTLTGKKKQPPPQTAAEKEAQAALLVEEVAKLPSGKPKKKRKREKEKKAAEQKLATATSLTAEAMAQRPAEVSAVATAKVKAVRGQVDEVKDLMHDNMRRLLERGERLEDIADKAESLVEESSGFKKSSKALKRDLAIENLLLTFVLIGFALGLLAGGYFCLFYGILNKLAIPIIATSMACGGGVGLLLSVIIKKLYTLFKDSPLHNGAVAKKKVKEVTETLDKATPSLTTEQRLTEAQEAAFYALLEKAEAKPALSFSVCMRPSFKNEEVQQETVADKVRTGITRH